MAKTAYLGYIKDYEGATLMGCELNPKISYTNFSSIIRKQREVSEKKTYAKISYTKFSSIIRKQREVSKKKGKEIVRQNLLQQLLQYHTQAERGE